MRVSIYIGDDIPTEVDGMERSQRQRQAALNLLKWQRDLGADEAITGEPVNRFCLPKVENAATVQAPRPAPASTARNESKPRPTTAPDVTATDTRELAAQCTSLEELYDTIGRFDGCALKRDAMNTVIWDGNPNARVMIVGEAPGADEDKIGRPFVGAAGQLLDLALSYIGLDRKATDPDDSFYITNVVYWRPPGNRTPAREEVALLLPFAERHIALADPEILLLLGNVASQGLRRITTGITRIRGEWGHWTPSSGGKAIKTMSAFHPAYLLRNPIAKRLFWQDLLAVQDCLETGRSEDG